MRFRKALMVIGICAGVLVAVALAAPLQFRQYACLECGACRPQLRVMYVPVLWRTDRPKLYHYWLKNVEPDHSHRWVEVERTETFGIFIPRRHITYNAWSNLRWDVDEAEMIRTLQSLPDAQSRKSFVNALWRAGDGSNREFTMEFDRARHGKKRRTD